MSTNNKNNLATQALIEMDSIKEAIKEESKKSLKALLSEAVKDAIRESCNEVDDENDYEVIGDEEEGANGTEENTDDSSMTDIEGDVDTEVEDETVASEEEDEGEVMGQEGSEVETDVETDENGGSEWDEFSKYQVGDDTYDLTGENDYESVVKVYKLLKDDDQIVVKKDGDKIQLKDDSVGTEYVIDLGGDDGNEAEVEESEENFDSMEDETLNENYYDSDFMDDDDEDSYLNRFLNDPRNQIKPEDDIMSEPEGIAGFDDSEYGQEYDEGEGLFESKMSRKINKIKESKKTMKESKEVLFEVDLGYTDNYQDKDPIAGLSNSEPSKGGKSWHKGVPTGTEKPWAGETKSKGEPFEKTISEEEMPEIGDVEEPMEEGTNVGGAVQQRSNSKSHIPANRKEHGPKNKRHVSTEANYEELVSENKKLKSENKELKEAIISVRKYLSEAYVTNANLGKITKLFLENTTSQSEKIEIVNRFSNEAKTIEQSKALYESIKRELNKPVTTQMPMNESMSTANGSTILNENKVYKSDDLLKTIDLMNRMKNM